jgi:hypothetical protein
MKIIYICLILTLFQLNSCYINMSQPKLASIFDSFLTLEDKLTTKANPATVYTINPNTPQNDNIGAQVEIDIQEKQIVLVNGKTVFDSISFLQ